MSPYGYDIIVCGKCSLCGGRVVLPRVWMSVIPATPICERCGAVEDDTISLPVIPMKNPGLVNDWKFKQNEDLSWCTKTGPHVMVIFKR